MRTDKKLWRNRKTKKELARRLQSENRGPEGGANGQKTRRAPLPHARTSLQAQVHDKSGSADPLLGPDCTHPYIYVRLPNMTRCPYLYAYAASRS
jgi:hypothetical protein